MAKAKKWSDEEVAYLVAHYPSEGAEKVGKALGRTKKAAHTKACLLGISQDKAIGLTDTEKQAIATLSEKLTAVQIARTLKRGEQTVRRYMRTCGLGCYKPKSGECSFSEVCKPPDSCFSCPFKDCKQFTHKVTPREMEFLRIGLTQVGE